MYMIRIILICMTMSERESARTIERASEQAKERKLESQASERDGCARAFMRASLPLLFTTPPFYYS
jgi:hypothetical protein